MRNIPSLFQRRTIWTALTAVCIATLIALLVGVIYVGTRTISFLQPLLIPFAVAGVLAYLLEPVVERLMKWGLSRHKSVLVVFSFASLVFAGVLLIVIPVVFKQSAELAKVLPGYTTTARDKVATWAIQINDHLRKDYGLDLLRVGESKPAQPMTADKPLTPAETQAAESNVFQSLINGEWIQKELPSLMKNVWGVIESSVGGFLGVFGFLVSLVIVPLYLYYFLTDSPVIKEKWSDYVPLRNSKFKDEVVGTLTEINRYLIAFFRGQLVVSLINGVCTAIGLSLLGLKFGWLIGLTLCVVGIIPYLGVALCWIPSAIIASVQGGSWMFSADHQWWVFPLAVTGVFVFVQQFDGLFVTPRIVGESVGLHPMTVIASVFAWSLILGGLLGAILAVPMTAAMKVLFQRYIWQRAVVGDIPPAAT